MSKAEEVKLSLKVMINKEKTKVLFAEADSHFTDVLLSFLTLPLAKIVKILEKQYGEKAPVFGSVNSLYKGLASLDDFYFSTKGAKQMLLNPANSLGSECCKLKLDITQPPTYYTCGRNGCQHGRWNNISMYYGISTCVCGHVLNKKVDLASDSSNAVGGVFTMNTASFLISDDLRILPYVWGIRQTLNNLDIKEEDMDGAEMTNVAFGFNEIVDLLMRSLFSPTPLSDLVFNKRQVGCAARPAFVHQIKKEESSNIVVKVFVQKSSNKLMFAQAKDDFVNLLCSFLIIPMGGIASLLEGNTCFKNIDNLYSSLANSIDDKYFQTLDTKMKLIKPRLPHGYISKNHFLPLDEETAPQLYYKLVYKDGYYDATFSHDYQYSNDLVRSFKPPECKGNYAKELMTYNLSDDLTVTPFFITSSLAIIDQMNIPFADVDELDVQIGLEEALSILKASLTSTSALTNGLMNRIMKKQPKREN